MTAWVLLKREVFKAARIPSFSEYFLKKELVERNAFFTNLSQIIARHSSVEKKLKEIIRIEFTSDFNHSSTMDHLVSSQLNDYV